MFTKNYVNINKKNLKKQEEENNIENTNKNKETNNPHNITTQIKKPIMTETEYQNYLKKRELMKKYSKYKPMTLLFGKNKKGHHQLLSKSANSEIITNPNINNTKIQINNYTTYLTSAGSIKEENYKTDGKTLMLENPYYYSMKQLNYKTRNTRLNQIMIIYIRKINESEDLYNFTNVYLSFIIQIFEKMCQPFILSLSNLFANHIEPQLKYFQQLVPLLQDFSSKIKSMEIKETNGNYDSDINLINAVLKLNNSYSKNFNLTSNNIQNIIINNQLYIKLDAVETKFLEIYNKMKIYINKLIKRRNKYQEKYKKDMEPYFSGIKQRLNDSTFYEFLASSKDFIFIQNELIFYTNKILTKISNFLINMDILFKTSHNTFCDYLELLNIIAKSFYIDNINVMNISSLLNKKSIIYFDYLLNEKDLRKSIEKRFQFNKIIENSDQEGLFNDINHSLLNYRDHLFQFSYIKKEDIDDIINFNLINYDSSEKFIQFLMKLIPEKQIYKFNDIIECKMNIKKYTSLLSGWKNLLLIITYQSHIYLFSQDKQNKLIKKKESESTNNKKLSRKEIINSIMEEEKNLKEINRNEKTDNNEIFEALKNNKLIYGYNRKNFGMVKLVTNNGKKLMQFFENYNDFKQYNAITIDMITEENMNNLINIIRGNKYL